MSRKNNKLKTIVAIISIVLLITILVSSFLYIKSYYQRKSFLANLKGEIVFTQRDLGIINIYKISANGEKKQMLYHNEDPINSNSGGARWYKDESKIYFGARENGKMASFLMDSNGNNLTHISDDEWKLLYADWRLNKCPICTENKNRDLYIREGSLYRLDESGEEIIIYNFKNYDSKFNLGVLSPSWSPDKEFIIFQLSKIFARSNILISNKDGTKVVKLTKGGDPDWRK